MVLFGFLFWSILHVSCDYSSIVGHVVDIVRYWYKRNLVCFKYKERDLASRLWEAFYKLTYYL